MNPNTAVRGLAVGRIVSGVAALAAPAVLAKVSRVEATPALTYMIRIFGARAVALGLGYLASPEAQRFRWQRLGLMVDAIDTVQGTGHLLRGDVPRTSALGLLAFTGGFMAVGAARLARDLAS